MRHHRATVGAADCLGETVVCTYRVSFAPENVHTFRRDVWLTLPWIRDHRPPRDLAAPTARDDPGTVAPRTESPLRHWRKAVQTCRVLEHRAESSPSPYSFALTLREHGIIGSSGQLLRHSRQDTNTPTSPPPPPPAPHLHRNTIDRFSRFCFSISGLGQRW